MISALGKGVLVVLAGIVISVSAITLFEMLFERLEKTIGGKWRKIPK